MVVHCFLNKKRAVLLSTNLKCIIQIYMFLGERPRARVVMIRKHKRAEEMLDKQETTKCKKTAKNTRWRFSPSFPCVNTKLF